MAYSYMDLLQKSTSFSCWGASGLDAVLQLESQESGIEWENHLPLPAVHFSFGADQDTVGCHCTLSDHIYRDIGDVIIYIDFYILLEENHGHIIQSCVLELKMVYSKLIQMKGT